MRAFRRRALLAAALIGLACAALVPVVASFRSPVGDVPAEGFEALRAAAQYQTSDTCVSCHPDHHRPLPP